MFLSAFFITNASLLFFHQFFYCVAQLVGTRCGLAVAAYALEACNDILVLHSLYQACDALQVAVAAALEFHICENTVLARYINVSGAGSVGGVCYCFHFTNIFLPSIMYKPLLGFSTFLPCKS